MLLLLIACIDRIDTTANFCRRCWQTLKTFETRGRTNFVRGRFTVLLFIPFDSAEYDAELNTHIQHSWNINIYDIARRYTQECPSVAV